MITALVAQTRADASELAERLQRDGPPSWQNWRKDEQRLAGFVRYELWSFEDSEQRPPVVRWFDFKRKGELSVTILGREGNEQTSSSVFADGPRYSFSLERASGTGPWIIRGLNSGAPAPPNTHFRTVSNLAAFLAVPRCLEGVPLEELISGPRFKMKGIAEKNDGGVRLVRIDFEVPPDKDGARFENAWMELNPEADWAIVRAEYSRWDYSRTSVRNEYRSGRDGRMRLSQCIEVTTYAKAKIVENRRYTFNNLEAVDEQDSTFTLSAFGLPEPDRPAVSTGGSLHSWFFGSAAFLIGIALYLRWKACRP